jgi:hypothetical protein
MDGDDYLVVMVYVNQILLGYLCMLRVGCKHPHVNQLILVKLTYLIVVNLDASRLMIFLVLFKAFACLAVIFWSPQISLAECSHSSFDLVVFLCAGEELLPLFGDADGGCQWEVQTDKG